MPHRAFSSFLKESIIMFAAVKINRAHEIRLPGSPSTEGPENNCVYDPALFKKAFINHQF